MEVAALARALEQLASRPEQVEQAGGDGQRLLAAAARLVEAVRRRTRDAARARDRDVLAGAAIRSGQEGGPAELSAPRPCYVCGVPFTRRHAFYDAICPRCAEEGQRRRGQSADLNGRRAVVTGGRVRIGFCTALKLLRAGAHVLVTTRFPRDAARRFAEEMDCAAWSERLEIAGLDLRPLPAVQDFAERLCAKWPALDILVNNAAQTIRRPASAYRALLAGEREELSDAARRMLLPPPKVNVAPMPLLALDEDEAPARPLVPADGLEVDTAERNSWGLRLGEVGLAELVEAHLVNGMAPFVLLQGLLPLLLRGPRPARFVVNVTSREGQASAGHDGRHPHTDMAKASLNMLTRSCAEALAAQGVYVNSVDPGWVSHQGTAAQAEALEAAGVRPPLDAEDGAARVCAPIFDALTTGRPAWGKLFKDFHEAAW